MKTAAIMFALAAVFLGGCVQPHAVQVKPDISADASLLSPEGNSVASPTVASGNDVSVPLNTATSQPADQRATFTGGQAEAGRDQANRTTNVNIPVNVSGGGWVAAVFGLAAAAIILARILIHVRERRLTKRLALLSGVRI